MQTIVSLFEKQVEDLPCATALIVDQKQYDYQMINQYSEQIKLSLVRCGFHLDSPIGLCTQRSLDQLVGMLGILKAGSAYLPLDPTQPRERLHVIIQESRIPILLVHSAYQDIFKDYQGILICLDDVLSKLPVNCETIPKVNIEPHHLAYTIYTSGSTGIPKGVLIEHESVINYARWFMDYTKATAGMRIDWSTPYVFDMGVTTSIVALMLGLTVVLCSDATKSDPRAYLRHLQSNRINIIKVTPSYFKALLHEVSLHPIELPHLYTIILGGENLPMSDCRAWLTRYPKHTLFNEYGPTEATIAVSQYKINSDNINAVTAHYAPIGKIGTNMCGYILDASLDLVPSSELGELCIGGVCLARGYNHQAELTQQKFIFHSLCNNSNERLYRTGDLCRMQADGTLECVGRIDNQVKIRGFRIEIAEIEQRLCAHPAIENSVVVARENVREELQLLAYYILKPTAQSLNPEQLRHYLQQYLPHYMIPSAFMPIDAFPLTENGKLNPSALPQPFVMTSVRKPRTRMEKQLVAIWEEELGVNPIGIHDNFYELGGHSLNAARIVSQINKMSAKVITLTQFYQANNIIELAKIIKKSTKKLEKEPSLPSIDSLSHIPLSDFQLLLWFCKTFEPKAQKMNVVTRKRLHGKVSASLLNAAFNAVLQTHSILNVEISRFYPAQRLGSQHLFTIDETDLQQLTPMLIEEKLMSSFDELMSLYPWPTEQPLFTAKLFHLDCDTIELQFCLAHFIADEVSMQIFLNDLSKFYMQYQKQSLPMVVKPALPFNTYIWHEQNSMATSFQEDYLFWRDYLNTGGLFYFPADYIESDMQKKGLNYTTYHAIPTHLFACLERFCIHQHVGLEDLLCAAVSIALKKQGYYYHDLTRPMIVNLIKSTRNDPIYDETVGCFIRVDPVKVDLSESMALLTISKQVQRSMAENQMYQRASTLLKLACSVAQDCKRTFLKSVLAQTGLFLYQKALNSIKLNYNVLKFIHNLADFDRDKHFVIYINVWNNFVKPGSIDTELLGLKTRPLPMYQYEISRFDYVCDISFLCDEYKGTRYVTVSGNLKADIRQRIAQEIITVLEEAII